MLNLFEQIILNEAAPRRAKQLNITPDDPPDMNKPQQPQDQNEQPPQDPNNAAGGGENMPTPEDMDAAPEEQNPQAPQQQQGDEGGMPTPGDMQDGEGGGEADQTDGQSQQGEEVPQGPGGDMGSPADELDQAEAEVFADLKPEQIAIKTEELKEQFKSFNDMIVDTLEKLDKVSKTSYDANMIDFVVRKLLELKDISRDSLVKAFKTRTYVQNQIELQKMIMTFNMLTNMISEIYDARIKRANKYDKDKPSRIESDIDFSQDMSI